MFQVLSSTRSAQAAVMTLRPGQNSGPIQNEHRRAEQWLFVVTGRGQATINGKKIMLKERLLVLIPRRARHQIKNTSNKQMVTLNFYAPPAYTADGNVRRNVK